MKALVDYKFSKFNIEKKYDSKMLLFNTFSEALILLDDEETKEYEALKFSTVHFTHEPLLSTLIEKGFLVDKEIQEDYRLKMIRQQGMLEGRDRSTYTILTTQNCNARCFYCFEKPNEQCVNNMSLETAEQVVRYISNNITEPKPIVLDWFGGEPLLNTSVITKICNDMEKICKEKNIQFFSSMVTNGSLFNMDTIESDIKLWHLEHVQISLDGLNDDYEKRKNYKNGKSYFGHIIKIMHLLLEHGVKVTVRLNLDKYNFSSFEDMLSFFKQFQKYSGFKLFARPLDCHVLSDIDRYFASETDYKEASVTILKMLIDNGYIDASNPVDLLPKRTTIYCLAHSKDRVVIMPNGDLYKCTYVLSDPTQKVGNCAEGQVINEAYCSWVSETVRTECTDCVYLPLCQGGCNRELIGFSKASDCFQGKFIINEILDLIYKSYMDDDCAVTPNIIN